MGEILIKTACAEEVNLPYNYHLQLNNSIKFALITGIDELERSGQCQGEHLSKLKKVIVEEQSYTYSKFNFFPKNLTTDGFSFVKRGEIIFSCPLPNNYFKYFLNIFNDYKINFFFSGKNQIFTVTYIHRLFEPEYTSKMRFITKSPIAACKSWTGKYNTIKKHFYNYLKEKERYKYVIKIKESLIDKYEKCTGEIYTGNQHLYMKFDKKYMKNYDGKISKLIHFENEIKIKAFEAPFSSRRIQH